MQLPDTFFDQFSTDLAVALLGKVIRHLVVHKGRAVWLSARIIETEAYAIYDKASHASLGYTAKRAALFMAPGTIYMYYARGGDSLNVSARGQGNAVLIKSGYPFADRQSPVSTQQVMLLNNPIYRPPTSVTAGPASAPRPLARVCAGQTLLCRALGLRVAEWDQRQFDPARFYFDDVGYEPTRWIQCSRLGITSGRDEDLPWRFVDATYARVCSKNPLTRRNPDYLIHSGSTRPK